MDNHWASDNLHVIRTLMERAALYRRALAPILVATGILGLAGGWVTRWTPIDTTRAFAGYWILISLVGLTAAYLLVRRQALQAGEPFWSPPARRVTQALAPPFVAGLTAGCIAWLQAESWPGQAGHLAGIWMVCYGTALHATGFFTVRGIRRAGWFFVLTGLAYLILTQARPEWSGPATAHMVMALSFGGCQLGWGIYLYFTERTPSPL